MSYETGKKILILQKRFVSKEGMVEQVEYGASTGSSCKAVHSQVP